MILAKKKSVKERMINENFLFDLIFCLIINNSKAFINYSKYKHKMTEGAHLYSKLIICSEALRNES